MPPDLVQIGPIAVSKAVVDCLAPLLGTIIGGLITYLATRAVENRKWDQQMREKLQEQRREAIGRALEWIAPIESALGAASPLTSALHRRMIGEDHFRRGWPDLLSTLSTKDVPPRLKVLLPPDTYRRGFEIVRQLDRLRSLNLLAEPTGQETPEDWQSRLDECLQLIGDTQRSLDALEQELADQYVRTFT